MEDRSNKLIDGNAVRRMFIGREFVIFKPDHNGAAIVEHFPFHSRRMNIAAKITPRACSSAAA